MKIKTRQLTKFQERISELNLHFSHFLFLSEQFLIDHQGEIQKAIQDNPKALAPELFPSNRFKEQFNSPLNKLLDKDGQIEETRQFIFQSLFIFSYVQFETYLKDLYNLFVQHFISVENWQELKKNESFLDQIIANLQLDIEPKICLAAEYIRYRRNAVIHRDKDSSFKGKVADFIKRHGAELNSLWLIGTEIVDESEEKLLQSINFESELVSNFSELEIIDIFNLLRAISRSLDAAVTTYFEEAIQDLLLTEFRKKYENKPWFSGTTEVDQKKKLASFKYFAKFLEPASVHYNDDEDVDRLYSLT
jgi:hypothetical protein